jgi:hypothetical protein
MAIESVVTGNNADLIAEVAKLYAQGDPKIADLTYGKGVFWRQCPELNVTCSDLITVPDRPYDFRDTPYRDATFDIAVLDPPYIHSPGEHQTDSRYQNAATTKGMLWRDLRQQLYIPRHGIGPVPPRPVHPHRQLAHQQQPLERAAPRQKASQFPLGVSAPYPCPSQADQT